MAVRPGGQHGAGQNRLFVHQDGTQAAVGSFAAPLDAVTAVGADEVDQQQVGINGCPHRLAVKFNLNFHTLSLQFHQGPLGQDPDQMGAVGGGAAHVAVRGDALCREVGESFGALRRHAAAQQALLVPQDDGLHGPGTDGEAVLAVYDAGCTGEGGEVGAAVAHGFVGAAAGGLFHNETHQDVTVLLHLCELLQRDHAALVQFYVSIHGQEHRQHVGKAEAAEDAAAHGGHIAELNAYDVFHGPADGSLRIFIQGGVLLQCPQGNHSADGKFFGGFLNGIQPQVAQVDGGGDGDAAHFQPQHAAENAVSSVLVQVIGLVKALDPHVILNRQHRRNLLVGIFGPNSISQFAAAGKVNLSGSVM